MSGTSGDPPGDDDLDLRITPVDDEFAETAPRQLPKSPVVEPDPLPRRRTTIITSAKIANREPPRRSAPQSDLDTNVAGTVVRSPRSVVRLYGEAIIIAFAMWLFVSTFIVQPVAVPTGSMLNTILVGDHILVNRFAFGTPSWLFPLVPYAAIRRGDVVVFKHPNDPRTLYVKRVIALPGETVEIYGTRVYVDGKEIPERRVLVRDTASEDRLETAGEPRVTEGATYTVYFSELRDLGDADDDSFSSLVSADRGMFGVGKPFAVPSGQYFCMGDNRDNSEDSRFWGSVPRDNIVGRAMMVYWSAQGTGFFPRGVRWSRIGALVR